MALLSGRSTPSWCNCRPEQEAVIDKQRVSAALELPKAGAPPRSSGTASKPEISSELRARCAEASVHEGVGTRMTVKLIGLIDLMARQSSPIPWVALPLRLARARRAAA